jgi:hypothetical protein
MFFLTFYPFFSPNLSHRCNSRTDSVCQRKHYTPGDRVSLHWPGPSQELLERDGTRRSLPAKPSPNPDDAGPVVLRPIGLPVAAGCDRSWTQPGSRVAQLAVQCLRPLRHSGGRSKDSDLCLDSVVSSRSSLHLYFFMIAKLAAN